MLFSGTDVNTQEHVAELGKNFTFTCVSDSGHAWEHLETSFTVKKNKQDICDSLVQTNQAICEGKITGTKEHGEKFVEVKIENVSWNHSGVYECEIMDENVTKHSVTVIQGKNHIIIVSPCKFYIMYTNFFFIEHDCISPVNIYCSRIAMTL